MAISLADLAHMVGGRVVGDPDQRIEAPNTLSAAGERDITLLDSPDKLHLLSRSKAGAVVLPMGMPPVELPAIEVADVHRAFAQIVSYFRPPRPSAKSGIHPQAVISPAARISADAEIHAGAFVGDDVEIGPGTIVHSGVRIMAGCRIAENVTLFPNVVLYDDTRIGPRSIVHSGAVLGAYGFGYKLADGKHVLSSQLGYVELGAEVEIGAGTTIDRGTYGPTLIGEGTKIDNLVMIAHNCRIGRHNLICSQVGVAGSTTTGDYVVMAGQVGVRDHVHIGARAVLGAKAGVANDVEEGMHVLGAPAVPEREQKLRFASIAKLPEMRKQLKQLQRQLDELLQQAQREGDSASQSATADKPARSEAA